MHNALAEVLKHPAIWRGDGHSQARLATQPSGHALLDQALPGGGWPKAAVSELLVSQSGVGELRLLLPAVAALTQAGRQVVLIRPPHIPYAPAWQAAGVDLRHLVWLRPSAEHDIGWAAEQALREAACGAVIAWFEQAPADRHCRRLQLAAEAGGGCGFVLRQGLDQGQSSPFGLRLGLAPVAGGLAVRLLKRRGMPLAQPLFLPHSQPAQTRSSHAVAGTASALATARRAVQPALAH